MNIWCVRESPDLCSGGMFVSDMKWNVAYIHVVYSCDKVEEEHALTVFMCYWVNICCVRGHLIYLVVACLCQIRSGIIE